MTTFDLAWIRQRMAGEAHRECEDDAAAAAAVATILRVGPEGAELLVIRRAEREGDPWSGHLAFPGGKREPTDSSLLMTATRETLEEVGLVLDPPSYLTRLDDVVARKNGYRVAQFVFAVEDAEVAPVTSQEVAATMWVPLARLARREGAGTVPFEIEGRSYDLPCFRIGSDILWGMTYRMTLQLLGELGISVL
jgi:8-oxo-dGTP pyrophosphatase MutT (NUDIX family)